MGKQTRLNRIYHHMVNRCYNTKLSCYKDYGGRGITICDEWFDNSKQYSRKGCQSKGWIAFRDWALSHGYRDDLTIDRIDNNKGYLPDNCRWVTPKEQSRNRRSNKLITFKGKSQLLSDWCKELGLKKTTVSMRINAYGWSIEKALETPGRKST